jgi:hypothetical protein
VLPLSEVDSWLMMLVKAEVSPFTTVAKLLVVVERLLELMILDVATTPFVVLVRMFPVEDSVLVVDEATRFESEVVANTPFTVEERITPEADSVFELIIEVELATPLTVDVKVLALLETPLLEMTEEVATTPLIVVVKVLPVRLWVKLLIRFVKALWIPFTRVLNELVVVLKVLEVTLLEVAIIPFTVEVMVLPLVVSRLVVDEASAPAKLDVAITPLTFDVSTTPETDRVLELTAVEVEVTPFTFEVMMLPAELIVLFEITEEVEVTPFTFVVRVLPLSEVDSWLMMLVKAEVSPFTTVAKLLVVVERLLELMMVEVATDPPILEVRVLLILVSVFGAERSVTVKLLIVVVARLVVPVAFKLPVVTPPAWTLEREAVPVAVILPVMTLPKVAIEAKRFVNIPVTEFIKFETMLDRVLVALELSPPEKVVVPFSVMLLRASMVVVVATPFTIEVIVLVLEAYDILLVVEAAIAPGLTHIGVPDALIVNTWPMAPGVNSDAVFALLPTRSAPVVSGRVGRLLNMMLLSVELLMVPPVILEFEIFSPDPPSTGDEMTTLPPEVKFKPLVPDVPGIPWGPRSPCGPGVPGRYWYMVLVGVCW